MNMSCVYTIVSQPASLMDVGKCGPKLNDHNLHCTSFPHFNSVHKTTHVLICIYGSEQTKYHVYQHYCKQ